MTGLAADVNRRNFSAACPGPPRVEQFTIWNLQFTSGRQKETNRFLPAAKQVLPQRATIAGRGGQWKIFLI